MKACFFGLRLGTTRDVYNRLVDGSVLSSPQNAVETRSLANTGAPARPQGPNFISRTTVQKIPNRTARLAVARNVSESAKIPILSRFACQRKNHKPYVFPKNFFFPDL